MERLYGEAVDEERAEAVSSESITWGLLMDFKDEHPVLAAIAGVAVIGTLVAGGSYEWHQKFGAKDDHCHVSVTARNGDNAYNMLESPTGSNGSLIVSRVIVEKTKDEEIARVTASFDPPKLGSQSVSAIGGATATQILPFDSRSSLSVKIDGDHVTTACVANDAQV